MQIRMDITKHPATVVALIARVFDLLLAVEGLGELSSDQALANPLWSNEQIRWRDLLVSEVSLKDPKRNRLTPNR